MDSGYLYNNSAPTAERRLRGLEAIEDMSSIGILAELGVASGWHCLEIGAGAGSVARWLADSVGRSGRVVATDIDTQFLDPAAYEVWQHDILKDALPEAAFDLVHFRHVLIHVEAGKHATVLRSISNALKPGGLVLAEESDLTSWRVDPRTPDPVRTIFAMGVDAVLKIYQSRGMDPYLGSGLKAALEGVGFKPVGFARRARRVAGVTAEAEYQRASTRQLAESIRASSPADAALLEEFADCFSDPRLTYETRATISVSAAKPETPEL